MLYQLFITPCKIEESRNSKKIFIIFIKCFALLFFIKATVIVSKYYLDTLGLPFNLVNKWMFYDEPLENSSRDFFQNRFFQFIIFFPVFEELAFRLSLKRWNKTYAKISTSMLLVLTLAFFISFNFLFPLLYFLGFVIFFLILNNISFVDKFFHEVYSHYYLYYYYLLIVLFSVLHINNYHFGSSVEEIPILFLLIFDKFLYALIFTFLRLKAGVLFAILLHSLNNAYELFI